MTPAVARHRTALSRSDFSRPVATAFNDGFINDETTFFDYGCGRGDDIRRLTKLGISSSGWDPVHRASAERNDAAIVNLGYVVNVIEDPVERVQVLRSAWALATELLIVSARLNWDARDLQGRPMRDGILTVAGTFQKFFSQEELRAWIEGCLGIQPVAAAPGIFYVFRNPVTAQAYLARRVNSRAPLDQPWVSEALFERHQAVLTPLLEFLTEHARLPRGNELPEAAEIRRKVGSLVRAFSLISHATGAEYWETLRARRARDLLVYLALSRFQRRPMFNELADDLRNDVRVFFRSYAAGCAQADRLLFAAGNTETVDLTMRASQVGKRTPSALYIHRDALDQVPPVLRVLEGCARTLSGEVEGATLVKLSRDQPQISYLSYPEFDRDPHPELNHAVIVNLRKLSVDFRNYADSPNPPILHRKEEFLSPSDKRVATFSRLTQAELRAGLYEHPERIGTKVGWGAALSECGVSLRGHRLIRAHIE
jgi:DNA phosphorothioation-associated putative methyltransferase